MPDVDRPLDLAGIARAQVQRLQPGEQRPPPDPVARVAVDISLAHLDRPFDYSVPSQMSDLAVPGARVKVRFAGKDVDGYILARQAESEHARLQPLRRVVSPEPVLSPEIAELADLVAQRWCGTRADVLRSAIPKRHAAVEGEDPPAAAAEVPELEPGPWQSYDGGREFLLAAELGQKPRAVITLAPAEDWAAMLARAVATSARNGAGVIACVPDRRDLDRLDAALQDLLGPGQHAMMAADLGPKARYRSFLAVRRGSVRIAIGTRSACFAPVADLGMVFIWDDGDDLYAEPRAPYWHAREVLLERARQVGAGVGLLSGAQSVEAQYLLATGWAHQIELHRDARRERARIEIVPQDGTGARQSRLPPKAFAAIRSGLEDGAVLVQVPRTGWAVALACESCRSPARCPDCAGPLNQSGPSVHPQCRWCGWQGPWHCPNCGGTTLRAPIIGAERTGEELARAFPGATVVESAGDRVVAKVKPGRRLVVATPGAEPTVADGYQAVVLLDTWQGLARADLRAGEESLRRWANAALLVRPGGEVIAVGDPGEPALQALLRWDPAGFAERELADRHEARLPPACRIATLTAVESDLSAFLAAADLPASAETLGPVPAPDRTDGPPQVRYVVRTPRGDGPALVKALREVQAERAARKEPHVQVRMDPIQID